MRKAESGTRIEREDEIIKELGIDKLGTPPREEEEEKAIDNPDYESWTMPRLRRRAKELGIINYKTINNEELIGAIRERSRKAV